VIPYYHRWLLRLGIERPLSGRLEIEGMTEAEADELEQAIAAASYFVLRSYIHPYYIFTYILIEAEP
jgi:hypothetical protein